MTSNGRDCIGRHDAVSRLDPAQGQKKRYGAMSAAGIDRIRPAAHREPLMNSIRPLNQVCAYLNYSNRLLNGLGVTTEGDVIGYYAEEGS
jgi:hypothetical protein